MCLGINCELFLRKPCINYFPSCWRIPNGNLNKEGLISTHCSKEEQNVIERHGSVSMVCLVPSHPYSGRRGPTKVLITVLGEFVFLSPHLGMPLNNLFQKKEIIHLTLIEVLKAEKTNIMPALTD